MLSHEAVQSTTLFLSLQNNTELDLRDTRGKIHNLPIVLVGLILGLLRKRDGNLSSIHRAMKNTHEDLMKVLKDRYDIDYQKVISRSHLPILLKKVCSETFSSLIFNQFGVVLTAEEKTWFAMDGKELRGTIQPGHTRGEAIVQAIGHKDKRAFCQGYYNGSKESEQPVVQELLRKKSLASQGITIDALHFNPTTLSYIAQHGGSYVVSLKGNQEEISKDMAAFIKVENADFFYKKEEKGHGREECRIYYCKSVKNEYFDKRWNDSNITTVIMVKRTRYIKSEQKYSEEISYYITNEKISSQAEAEAIFQHIRGHWSVEVNNHIRDVSFKEDDFQTKFKLVARPFTLCRTLIINILQSQNIKNMVAIIDGFIDKFSLSIQFLIDVKVRLYRKR